MTTTPRKRPHLKIEIDMARGLTGIATAVLKPEDGHTIDADAVVQALESVHSNTEVVLEIHASRTVMTISVRLVPLTEEGQEDILRCVEAIATCMVADIEEYLRAIGSSITVKGLSSAARERQFAASLPD